MVQDQLQRVVPLRSQSISSAVNVVRAVAAAEQQRDHAAAINRLPHGPPGPANMNPLKGLLLQRVPLSNVPYASQASAGTQLRGLTWVWSRRRRLNPVSGGGGAEEGGGGATRSKAKADDKVQVIGV